MGRFGVMNKKRAISIITKAARLYHENLEDQKVLFVYGIPSEIRKQLEDGSYTISGFRFMKLCFIDPIFFILPE